LKEAAQIAQLAGAALHGSFMASLGGAALGLCLADCELRSGSLR